MEDLTAVVSKLVLDGASTKVFLVGIGVLALASLLFAGVVGTIITWRFGVSRLAGLVLGAAHTLFTFITLIIVAG